jgi:hypothetical protein
MPITWKRQPNAGMREPYYVGEDAAGFTFTITGPYGEYRTGTPFYEVHRMPRTYVGKARTIPAAKRIAGRIAQIPTQRSKRHVVQNH